MSDQIIDLCESLQPGPRGGVGPRGEQGLPGVNAVPADEAVADWIGKQSKTRTALDANYARRRKCVLLGDSWTVVHSQWLYRKLQALDPTCEWHDYGINGAVVQRLPEMVAKAKTDPSCDPDEITDVAIVMGTNNVFWTKLDGYDDINSTTAYTAFDSVRECFKNARIHYFPNNSKTLNAGRNKLYRLIFDGARQAGCIVHADCLRLLANHLEWYNGDDQEGVQHLSDLGYQELACRIHECLKGGNLIENENFIGGYFFRGNSADKGFDQDGVPSLYMRTASGIARIADVKEYGLNFNGTSTSQTMHIAINGTMHKDISPGPVWIGNPHWYQRIASQTLPFVWLSSEYYAPLSFSNYWAVEPLIISPVPQDAGTDLSGSFLFRTNGMNVTKDGAGTSFVIGADFKLEIRTSPLIYDIPSFGY